MKKSILLIAIICMLIMPMNCFASDLSENVLFSTEAQVLLGTGYTDNGVYYEVYGDPFTVIDAIKYIVLALAVVGVAALVVVVIKKNKK